MNRKLSIRPRAVAVSLVALAFAGCSIGARYHRPNVAVPQSFTEASATTFDAGHPVASRLWHSFGDPTLDRLIDTALANNRTLAQVRAQLAEARALRGLEAFAFFPTVTAAASRNTASYSKLDPLVPPNIGKTTTFTAGFDASWEIDLFGASVSAERALAAQVRAADAALTASRQSIVAEVAQSYFSLRADQEHLRVQRRNVDNLVENQRLLDARFEGGRGTQLDTESARALYLGTSATLPQIDAAIVRDEQRLAVLTAQPIAALRTLLGAPTPLPAMPQLVAIGRPDEWFRRRPDIAQSEQNLISETAQIGVETANYFPQLTLLGGFGWTAQRAKDIGSAPSRQWNYGPSLSWSFLDIGRVHQRVKAQQARAAAAVAAYQDTVLRALEETENAFAGYRTANQSALMLEDAIIAARRATEIAQARFDVGATDTLSLLQTERNQLQIEDQLATVESQRATALAALYKALAGDFAAGP